MVTVRESTIVDAPVDEVWAILRDFNGHDRWHPAVASSAIEAGEPADMIGAVRAFRLADGSLLREQLLALSDDPRSYRYCLLEAPIPLMGYVAAVRLLPVTDGDRTFWEWSCEFAPPARRARELETLVRRDIYLAGFSAIRALLHGERSDRARRSSSLQEVSHAGPLAFEPPPYGLPNFSRATAAVAAASGMSDATASGLASNATGSHQPDATAVRRIPDAATSRPMHNERLSRGAENARLANGWTGEATTITNAVVVARHGGPEVLDYRQMTLAAPAAGEARIRHEAIGVNFIDVHCRTGEFAMLTPPAVLGMEGAGIVEAVGAGVTSVRVGQRVAYAALPVGAYADARNIPAAVLVALPDGISADIAAASLLKGITAAFLTHDVAVVRPGSVVVVHAAAGGVGQLLVQWARQLGATVIAAVSTEDKAAAIARWSPARTVLTGREELEAVVMAMTAGRGADIVYDGVGRATFAASLASLRIGGHLVSFGQASGPLGERDIGRLSARSLTISRPNYAHYIEPREKLDVQVTRYFDAVRRGAVIVLPPRVFRLDQAGEAHRELERRATIGALILRPGTDGG